MRVGLRQLAALCAILILAGLSLGLWALPAVAWDRHDLITRVILRNAGWLDAYHKLAVTPASGSECVKCDKDPYNPDYLPVFVDKLPGETTSAREILVRYVDEPDWGMDASVSISPMQPLAGGSKGYRHQYYYYGAGLVRIGEAPDRVKHFYDLALDAYREGDRYWAFRFLARAIHYLEDMGQPLHTQPYLAAWLSRTRLDLDRTTFLASNLHYAYERFVTHHLRAEIRRDGGPLLDALRKPPKMKFEDPYTAARALAEFSSNRAPDLLKDLDSFLPKRVKSMRHIVVPTSAEIRPTKPPAAYPRIVRSTVRSLEVTAGAVLSVLETARRDFAAADRARRMDE